ncbi:MAG: hypothetical protein SA339_00770 [Methanomassiliicoccus sp.]|nr:hypothetical protein [Methanomassiliicoccus sp.]
MNPRIFNTVCILAIIAVGAAAMFMMSSNPDHAVMKEQAGTNAMSPTGTVVLQPLSLGLSLAVVADLGIMTVGLVILFKDDAPGRD